MLTASSGDTVSDVKCEIDDSVVSRIGPHPFAVLIATGDMMSLQLIKQCVPKRIASVVEQAFKRSVVASNSR